jgi:hypothetical protein
MFQPDFTRDEALLYGHSAVSRFSARRDRQVSVVQDPATGDLSELEALIPADLSPNKRAILETLATLWESRSTSNSGYMS